MEDLLFTVEFIRNFTAPDWYVKQVQEEFIDRRDIAVEMLDGKYEEWNKAYDIIDPNNNGVEDTKYCKFISEKQDEVLKAVNDLKMKTNYILLKSDPEGDCDIICVLRQNNKAWMRITLKPMD